ncbi:hypothetical protein [Polyangium aurulentum]|uniref:hypothetical protein n=1 Tax=Polyangium aurulentum TaxID=2567896 RepID=UPI0010AE6C74|nr:hypothetical protein [Polyangium aurulentum]UQA56881.1 hypothetical protein E8A73_037135 [Polyangium aurulentum]
MLPRLASWLLVGALGAGITLVAVGCGVDDPAPVENPPVEVDAFLAACARMDACASEEGGAPIGINTCHSLVHLEAWRSVLGPRNKAMLSALDCKLAAKDCAAMRACEPKVSDFVDFCKEKVFGDHCSGNTLVVCDDGTSAPVIAVDCAANGLVCGEQYGAGCGIEPCNYDETKSKCEGDTLVECSPAGVIVRKDCRTDNELVVLTTQDKQDILYTIAGEACGIDNKDFKGEYKCIGKGAPCDKFQQQCDGTVLETCTGGYISRRDCAALDPGGMSCGTIQSGPFAGTLDCGPLDSPCTPEESEACEDGTISFCALTKPEKLDCRALGFSGCKTAQQGERVVAYCTP